MSQTGDFSAYLGLVLEDAEKKAQREGLKCRVKFLDGNPQMVTQDIMPDRLNFAVDNGKVTGITTG